MTFNHAVRTFDVKGDMLYEEFFKTAERAYEEYTGIIKLLNKKLGKGEVIYVARYSEGYLMTVEKIEK